MNLNPAFRWTLFFVPVVSFGCAMTQTRSTERIRFQMSQSEVVKVLGHPDRVVVPENSAEEAGDPRDSTYVYYLDGEVCQIDFRLGLVRTRPACQSQAARDALAEKALDRTPAVRQQLKLSERKRKQAEEERKRLEGNLRNPAE